MNMGLFTVPARATPRRLSRREKIRDILGPELVTLHNLKDDAPALMEQYDAHFRHPHLDFKEIQEDWKPSGSNWTISPGRQNRCAYGMGDQPATARVVPGCAGWRFSYDKLAPQRR